MIATVIAISKFEYLLMIIILIFIFERRIYVVHLVF